MKFKSAIITNEQVKKHMSLDKAIDCVEKTWKWHGEGLVVMPPKITTDMSSLGVNGWFNSMPSYLHPLDSSGLKLVGGYSDNPKKGMPFIRSNICLIDPHDGHLRALVCGDWISDARTGAQPAIAIKYLAASTDVLTIIGAGQQAHFVVECILLRHEIKELRICDIKPQAREKFAADFEGRGFEVKTFESNEKACTGADIIITVTTADAPLVREAWCKKGCLVLTMGSFTETSEDVPMKFDKIYLDCTSQGLHRGNFKVMAEKGIVSEESVEAELPEIAAGLKPGRTNKDDRIVCELVGMGSPDLCIATEVYN
ncbi:MAG: ornithine cyclodeaminase family protein, partial [Firmicutes bacterium]|nr:ornithine cyclodeaminase family protein [Bacillota bacterium]